MRKIIIKITFLYLYSFSLVFGMKREAEVSECKRENKVRKIDINSPIQTYRSWYNVPPLFNFCRDGQGEFILETIEAILNQKALLTYEAIVKKKPVKTTVLHWLAANTMQEKEKITELLFKTIDTQNRLDLINYPDHDGNMPLHIAVDHVNENMVKKLLEKHAWVNVLNNKNEMPFPPRLHDGSGTDFYFGWKAKNNITSENKRILEILYDAGTNLALVRQNSKIDVNCNVCGKFVMLLNDLEQEQSKKVVLIGQEWYKPYSYFSVLPKELIDELIKFMMHRDITEL